MKNSASATPGMRRSGDRVPARVVLLGLFLTFLVLISACGDEKGDVTFPTPDPIEPMNWIFDINGTSASDVWACGSKGAMFHFDGSTWRLADMGTDGTITQIFDAADGQLYACGHGGKIWRRSGSTWNSMETGTTGDFYSLGSYLGNIYACGEEGLLRSLSGSTWSGVDRNVMVLRDVAGTPTDTLYQSEDVAALLTINYYAIGGAYYDPNYEGEEIGMLGTTGMILTEDLDPNYDWYLRPLGGDQLIREEWIISSYSDTEAFGYNYLGTSEGWIYRLNVDGSWVLLRPKVTLSPGGGIRDMWLDALGNLYLVTDEGQVVFQTPDYSYVEGLGERIVLADFTYNLATIWAANPQDIYLGGFMDSLILHCSHDQETGEFVVLEEIPLAFPDKAAAGQRVDQFGRPAP